MSALYRVQVCLADKREPHSNVVLTYVSNAASAGQAVLRTVSKISACASHDLKAVGVQLMASDGSLTPQPQAEAFIRAAGLAVVEQAVDG